MRMIWVPIDLGDEDFMGVGIRKPKIKWQLSQVGGRGLRSHL